MYDLKYYAIQKHYHMLSLCDKYFRDELKLGHGKKPAFKDFELVALGMKDNVRAQLPPTGLTVEQQVSALIDQVTDPNILGRTWIGWEAWV